MRWKRNNCKYCGISSHSRIDYYSVLLKHGFLGLDVDEVEYLWGVCCGSREECADRRF